jgi:hypothetical protein
MQKQNNYADYKYVVNGRDGYHLTPALRLWKTKYQDDIRDFFKDVITHEQLKDFGSFVEECWDTIEPVTVEEAFQQTNTEDRRVFFDAIGIEKLFKSLEPTLLDKQVVKKKRTRWNDKFEEYTHEFEDVYELYQIDGEKMFVKQNEWSRLDPIFAVRCWCTTTNREYWLYVPREAAVGQQWWSRDEGNEAKADAIRAIAWTVRIDVPEENVEKIYRQGDIIVAKMKDSAKATATTFNPYHLSKEQYLSLMYSET